MKTIFRKLTPDFLLDLYYQIWAFLGDLIYSKPSKKIKVIGITGTNGKTTVTHLATDILEAAGYKVASISSLRFKIGDREYKNELKMTMPGRMKIQKFLREAVDAKCQYFVMEVTSEGIKQCRHKFIDFEIAVFTNLTPEHIESHGSFENYKKAKGELFKVARSAIINLDDKNAEYFAGLCKGEKRYYSLKSKDIDFKLSMLGEFNLYNALAAAQVGLSQGIDTKIIKQTLENSKGIPGRMEVVVKEPFKVIVDYAHTPDALEKVYKTIKESGESGARMICVLGAAGGGRDKWKRPQMGSIAAQYCEEIILTDEDPYDEDPAQILSQIKSGILNFSAKGEARPGQQFFRQRRGSPGAAIFNILDRKLAIKKAIQDARPGDVVIITGKGAEPWMMTGGGKIPWDDREIVREVLTCTYIYDNLKVNKGKSIERRYVGNETDGSADKQNSE